MSAAVLADLFCRVVDNYGDIGVGWRLARQLAHEFGCEVRLWVDDLHAFAHIEPGVAIQPRQTIEGIVIVHWTDPAPAAQPGQIAIELFGCDPPPAYIAAMAGKQTLWLNLDYLSAESWVESVHALPSRRADGLNKYFFFPGFTAATGGLLRETGLLERRDALRSDATRARLALRGAGIIQDLIDWRAHSGALLTTLFCYDSAPLEALRAALDDLARPTLLVVPDGIAPDLASSPRLRIARVPFMPQERYDALLWCADLNIVRGEDSFVRAIWAGKPLIWHIYPQADDAHRIKLDAWLARYGAGQEVTAMMRAFNAGTAPATPAGALPGLTSRLSACFSGDLWDAWRASSDRFCRDQASRPSLAQALMQFYETAGPKKR